MSDRPRRQILLSLTRSLCGALALGLMLGLALPAGAADYNAGEIRWRGLDQGLQEARRVGKPVFMLVQTEWCPTCNAYSGLFDRADVVAALNAFVPVLVDADEEPGEKRFRPDGPYIPRSLVLTSEGEVIKQVTGPYEHRHFLPPEDAGTLLDFLDRGVAWAAALEQKETLPPAEPSRKPAPTGPGSGPSITEAASIGGGPKRLRAPDPAKMPSATTPQPAEPAPAEPGKGLLDRLLDLVLS